MTDFTELVKLLTAMVSLLTALVGLSKALKQGSKPAYRTKCVSMLGASAQVDAPFSAV